jgi:hypothetical protein
MSKFNVGDRVRVVEDDAAGASVRAGDTGRVVASNYDGDEYEVVMDEFRGDREVHRVKRGFDWYFQPDDLEHAESLKLEPGCFVTIGDGKDEWEVINTAEHGSCQLVYAKLPGVESNYLCSAADVKVVRPKPEPPKPDYYVNVPGEKEPKPGDVFVANDDGFMFVVQNGLYRVIHPLVGSLSLRVNDGDSAHCVGGKVIKSRTLVVRDFKPYPFR